MIHDHYVKRLLSSSNYGGYASISNAICKDETTTNKSVTSATLKSFYDDELLKNARVRYEKFKPLSESVYPSTCSRCKKNISTRIKDVIFNDPATIVFWNDGTKTVVKAENEPFDREKGLAMAIAKKFLGNKGNYFETFKKYIKEEE